MYVALIPNALCCSAAATALVDCRVTLVLLLRWLLYALVCVAVDMPESAPEVEDRLTLLLPAGAVDLEEDDVPSVHGIAE